MTDPDRLAESLAALYPPFAGLPAELRARALSGIAVHRVPRGTRLFDSGTPCRGFPFVLAGGVRVARAGPDGRSLELYRVTPGEICIVSTGCLLSGRALTADGETAEDTELAMMDRDTFFAVTADPGVRNFVFGIFAERLADLCELIEAVAFHRLDRRLAELLLGHGRVMRVTHQELAMRLGSSREIVSRLLSRFAREGWVRSGRESIEVIDPVALRGLAAGGDAA